MTYKSSFLILVLLLVTTIARAQYKQVNDMPFPAYTIQKDHIKRLTNNKSAHLPFAACSFCRRQLQRPRDAQSDA